MNQFKLGQTNMTRRVCDMMCANGKFAKFVMDSLKKYVHCDWGTCCIEDAELNNEAVESGDRIFASYENETHPKWKLWIITECDRSYTTILFPDEY